LSLRLTRRSFARFGRDIFWRPDSVSNNFGAEWLGRHLGPPRFFAFTGSCFARRCRPISTQRLVPCSSRSGTGLIPTALAQTARWTCSKENDWQIVAAPVSVRNGAAPSRERQQWISMNILMLDPRTAIVEGGRKANDRTDAPTWLRGNSLPV